MRFAVIAFLLFMGLCVRAVPRVEIPPQGIAFGGNEGSELIDTVKLMQ